MTNKSYYFPIRKEERKKTLHCYHHVPVTPPSKGSSPIDFGNASCSPVIIGSSVAIWKMLYIKHYMEAHLNFSQYSKYLRYL